MSDACTLHMSTLLNRAAAVRWASQPPMRQVAAMLTRRQSGLFFRLRALVAKVATLAASRGVRPALTDDTMTYWPDAGAGERAFVRYGDLPLSDRHVVAWDAERRQYVGEYPY